MTNEIKYADLKKLTTGADADWRARCKAEDIAKEAWRGKFGWILDEYKILSDELKELRSKRPFDEKIPKVMDTRIAKPYPVTIAKQIGWLSSRPEFALEKYGPYPYTSQSKPPVTPT